MNQLCEICETAKPDVYCENCTKVTLYCNKCFECTHISDTKKAHKFKESISLTPEYFDIPIFCTYHPKKIKEYTCLNCRISICSDCMTLDKHQKHTFGSFQDGFTKVSEEFKSNLDSYEKIYKIAINEKENVMEYMNKKIEWLNQMKGETETKFFELNKLIELKKEEVISLITAKTIEIVKDREMVIKIGKEIRVSIDKVREILAKPNPVKIKDYENLFESNIALKEMELIVEKWFTLSENIIPKPLTIFPESLMKIAE